MTNVPLVVYQLRLHWKTDSVAILLGAEVIAVLKTLADNTNRRSLANLLRKRRFSFFRRLLADLPRPITILDVGGTASYWTMMGLTSSIDISITLLNIVDAEPSSHNIINLIGDARRMEFENKSFDVVFSNSVIEHVGGFGDQSRMAQEVRRVGKKYFIQTPNKFFPIEPHFLFPFYQFLPVSARVWLLRNFSLGWFAKTPDSQEASEIVQSIRLLEKRELLELFPRAHLYEEKILGMPKSYIVYDGWEREE